MSHQPPAAPERATELLELHDRLDRLDEQIRIRDAVLRVTPLVSIVLAVPLLVVLFMHEVSFFPVYPVVFLGVLGAILYAVARERRHLEADREELGDRIRSLTRLPPGRTSEGA